MSSFNIKALVIAISLAFSMGSMAAGMSKTDYQLGKDKIAAEYDVSQTACTGLSGNAKNICVVDAKGKEHVAQAELEADYNPSARHSYEVSIAKADAAYSLSKEKCEDLLGYTKDVCLKEAKAVEVRAKADARMQMKTAEASTKAKNKSAEARADAKADKADADYSMAREKCDSYAGGAKDMCLNQAKMNFEKSQR